MLNYAKFASVCGQLAIVLKVLRPTAQCMWTVFLGAPQRRRAQTVAQKPYRRGAGPLVGAHGRSAPLSRTA